MSFDLVIPFRNLCYNKNHKYLRNCQAPVVPATWEAEAGELRARGCSEPKLCHCTPAWVQQSKTPSQKQRKDHIFMTR